MRLGARVGAGLAIVTLAAITIPGAAGAKSVTKTKTFSSPAPTLFGAGTHPTALALRTFVPGAKIKSYRVKLRLDHPNVGEVDLQLLDNTGRAINLSTDNGGAGTAYGTGPNDCSGTPTVFEDAAPTPITGGTAPFEGSFTPETGPFAGGAELSGVFWLVASDSSSSAPLGTIGCWQIEFTYRKKK